MLRATPSVKSPTRLPALTAVIWTAAALAAGCAGTQRLGQTSGTEAEDDESRPAPVPKAVDPLAAGGKPARPAEKRAAVTEEAQREFEKAIERWERARREGTLASECAGIADDFGEVADDHPSLIEARGNQAAVLYECGKEAEATPLWEQLAARNYAPALAQMGYQAWRSGDVARAETLFYRAIEADKQIGSVSARLNLAQILREKSRQPGVDRARLNEEIQTHLRTVLAVDGNNLLAYATLCHFYFDLGRFEMARLVGQQAIWRGEEIATGRFVGARDTTAADEREATPARRGRRGAAAPAAAARADINVKGTGYTPEMKKSLGMVHNTLGLVWLKRKDVSQAIAHFRRAVDNDPALIEARMNLAALSLNYRDYPTAEENFRAVLKSDPKNYDAAIGLGVALRGNRKFDEAEQQYLAAQKLDPQEGDSYFNLGLLYQEYKGMDKPALQKAQQFYRDFLGRAGRQPGKRREAEKRIKDIDDTIAALEEAAKMQKEAEEMQRKMEEQQKKMEEDLKKMQEQEKQQAAPQAGSAPTAPPPAAGGGAGPAAAAAGGN